jgi:hypothetical protein
MGKREASRLLLESRRPRIPDPGVEKAIPPEVT